MHIEGHNSEVILLADHSADRVSVIRLLEKLEDLDIIRYSVQKRNALAFFAEEKSPPQIIIMFMDHQETYGVHFSQNYFLLTLHEFGAFRYFFIDDFPVHPVQGSTMDLIEALVGLARDTKCPSFCFN